MKLDLLLQKLWNDLDKNEMYSAKLEAIFIDVLNKITEDVIHEETAANEVANEAIEKDKKDIASLANMSPAVIKSKSAKSKPDENEAQLVAKTVSHIRTLRDTANRLRF